MLFYNNKGIILSRGPNNLKVYAPILNIQIMEQKMTELVDIDKSIATLKYFNTTLSIMEQVYKNISNIIIRSYNIVKQLDTISICRTLYLTKE